jgi:predicted HAD superfamily Cof-like phosphohydrolase
MKTNFEMIKEFHTCFNQERNEKLNLQAIEKFKDLRLKLIKEEYDEVCQEFWMNTIDPVALAKELTDLLYVVYGAGVTFGIDLDKCFEEVHRSNMSKLGPDNKPIYRDDGKVLKGPNYSPADVGKILYEEKV